MDDTRISMDNSLICSESPPAPPIIGPARQRRVKSGRASDALVDENLHSGL